MQRGPLVGHVVPRAVLKQQAALEGAAPPPAAVSALQDSDDVVRITSMIEVRARELVCYDGTTT